MIFLWHSSYAYVLQLDSYQTMHRAITKATTTSLSPVFFLVSFILVPPHSEDPRNHISKPHPKGAPESGIFLISTSIAVCFVPSVLLWNGYTYSAWFYHSWQLHTIGNNQCLQKVHISVAISPIYISTILDWISYTSQFIFIIFLFIAVRTIVNQQIDCSIILKLTINTIIPGRKPGVTIQ